MNNYTIPQQIQEQVKQALSEDLGNINTDYTANLIANEKQSNAYVKTNQDMVVCGIAWFEAAIYLCDNQAKITWLVTEGQKITANTKLCTITSNARSLLTAERTALNFLQTLSATATTTAQYVAAANNPNTKVMDTRKTLPLLRLAQKYAVTIGGGYNQRVGLFDGVLIKENHIIAHGGIKQVLEHAFSITPKDVSIQIEVENMAELTEAITNGAKLILLDNMIPAQISECVIYAKNYDKNIQLEASGNICLENIAQYAASNVDRISIGALTKNIQAIDLSMRFE